MSDNDLTKNVDFLQKIDETVKNIMKDGKIDQFDIPEIMLLFFLASRVIFNIFVIRYSVISVFGGNDLAL